MISNRFNQRLIFCGMLGIGILFAAGMGNQQMASAQSVENVSFDDFKFDIKRGQKFEDEMLTDDIKKYDEKKITIRGYILPSSRSKVKQFILVRDNKECCFGPRAMLFDCMVVRMEKGKTADFTVRPVAVTGEFRIKKFGPKERPLSIYEIKAESVK